MRNFKTVLVKTTLNWETVGSGSVRGLYFGPKTIFIPPPLWKWYFFLLSRHVVFRLPLWSFCLTFSLFCNYFTLLLPLFPFSFPFLSFSFLFLPFSFTFSLFFSSPFQFFSPKWHWRYFTPPPPGGRGGIFQNIDPWDPWSQDLLHHVRKCKQDPIFSYKLRSTSLFSLPLPGSEDLWHKTRRASPGSWDSWPAPRTVRHRQSPETASCSGPAVKPVHKL